MDPEEQIRQCNKATQNIYNFVTEELGIPVLLLDNSNFDTTFENAEKLNIEDPNKKARLQSLLISWYASCDFYKNDDKSPRMGRLEAGELDGGGRKKKTRRCRPRKTRNRVTNSFTF